ncbi:MULTISPECIES: FtsX-like permease family protein [unclassified Beijerinckia]|uniref:ABC transporter permease n=1 Tax=unclassified Beijerinckia TaxID=2638183 RepID=UPI000896CEAB|nr:MULTISPECIES: FtsX-like permease family protein [unclassified Beijerinckia]MDH7798058.1 putative ABC transport system permease protein [Beijerinckia sp. GAS462]SED07478.1 putative ABC transport system permease protein [Beijerinckia sp. 28-YEA-48]
MAHVQTAHVPMVTASALTRLGALLRFAVRDLRGGLRGFRIFLACIALGVTAIVGVNATSRGLSDSLAEEGRRILGGDISFSLIHRQANAQEEAWLKAQGAISTIATMRAMARAGNGTPALVELKAVDSNYPSLGDVETDGTQPLATLLEKRNGLPGAIADEALQARFNLKPGDRFFLGDGEFEFRATLLSEPDKLAGGIGFGPRVILSQQALQDTGLLAPGSLVRWSYRVLVDDRNGGAAPDAAIDTMMRAAEKAFPDAGWQIRTRNNVSPQFQKNIERFTQFLTLVGLTALIVGGVGVANAVRAFIDRRTPDFATLKSLGATGRDVFTVALTEVLLMSVAGIAIGMVLGLALPFVISWAFGSLIPVPFKAAVYPTETLSGLLYGVLTTLAFSLGPIGRAHDLPVSALFRDRIDHRSTRLRWPYLAMLAGVSGLLIATIIWLANDRRLALIYILATFGGMALLRLVSLAIIALARRAPRSSNTALRMAIANIHRPGALTHSVVLALGLGLALLTTLTLIDINIRGQLRQGMPGKTPSFFFMDIQNRQTAEFDAFLKANAPDAKVERVPMMRGRLVQLNDTRAENIKAKEDAAWVLEGDRGITYSASMPDGSTLVDGEWWPADYNGPPLVSMERDAAVGLGVHVGDTLIVNVLGRNITAKVANLRAVNWRTMGINFVFVFSPNTFAGAPHTHLATATFPDGDHGTQEIALLKELAATFPTITSIRIKDTLEAVSKIADQLAFAIRGATGIALAAALLVLGGALAAGQRARIYDAVILKTLGATRRRLLSALLLEYSILGAATAVFGVLAGSIAAWAIMTRVMGVQDYSFAWGAASLGALAALVVSVLLGLVATVRVLGQKPGRHLRDL